MPKLQWRKGHPLGVVLARHVAALRKVVFEELTRGAGEGPLLLVGHIRNGRGNLSGDVPGPSLVDVEGYHSNGPIGLASRHVADDVGRIGFPLVHLPVDPAEGAEVIQHQIDGARSGVRRCEGWAGCAIRDTRPDIAKNMRTLPPVRSHGAALGVNHPVEQALSGALLRPLNLF